MGTFSENVPIYAISGRTRMDHRSPPRMEYLKSGRNQDAVLADDAAVKSVVEAILTDIGSRGQVQP
jgi:hypothetical protein